MRGEKKSRDSRYGDEQSNNDGERGEALDAEWDYFPQNSSGVSHETPSKYSNVQPVSASRNIIHATTSEVAKFGEAIGEPSQVAVELADDCFEMPKLAITPITSEHREANVADATVRTCSADGIEKERKHHPDYSLTATIYLAAPNSLSRIGVAEEVKNSNWKEADREFQPFKAVNEAWSIFKGTVPAPFFGGSFKFVSLVEELGKTCEWNGPRNHRSNVLAAGSNNFFIWEPEEGGVLDAAFTRALSFLSEPTFKRTVCSEFLTVLFDRALEDFTQSWDDSFELLRYGLANIYEANDNLHESLSAYLDQRLSEEELCNNVNWILLVFTGASILNFKCEQLGKLVDNGSVKDISLLLFSIMSTIKRHDRRFAKLLEDISSYHPGFSWIVMRQNRVENLGSPAEATKALITTLNVFDRVLLHNDYSMLVMQRTICYLLEHNAVDYLLHELQPFFNASHKNRDRFDTVVFSELQKFKGNEEKTEELLQSQFLKEYVEGLSQSSLTRSGFNTMESFRLTNFLSIMLDLELQPLFKIALALPDHIRPIAVPVIDGLALPKLYKHRHFEEDNYNFFAQLDIDQLNPFPQWRSTIEPMLIKKTDELILQGTPDKVPSVKLLLYCLSRRNDIMYLERAAVADLQKILAYQHKHFFPRLNWALRDECGLVYETLNFLNDSNSKLSSICSQILQHFEHIDSIVKDLKMCEILLRDVHILLDDACVIECLKLCGAEEEDLLSIWKSFQTLRKQHVQYNKLFNELNRFEMKQCGEDKTQTFDVIDEREWGKYFKNIDPERSRLTVKAALDLPPPLPLEHANWLWQVMESKLFLESVWFAQIEESKPREMSGEKLVEFVERAAASWRDLAKSIDIGALPLSRMEKITALERDTKLLSKCHLQCNREPFQNISTSLRNFQNSLKIRDLIHPFVAALRFVNIRDRAAIDGIHEFIVNSSLVKNWNETTLEEVIRKRVINTVGKVLDIDWERLDTSTSIRTIASLATDGTNNSVLVHWLRELTEQHFEAMGRILHGTLLEACGQLKTLYTRAVPFLKQSFDTYQDLMRFIRDSDIKHVSGRQSGQVQEIKTEWLSSMLPEISAALRASTISPSEDAKGKLQKLKSVLIYFDTEAYTIRVQLTTAGDLSLDELKQAFQLLDMAASDSGEQLVSSIRRRVELIVRLAEVFDAQYTTRYIHRTQKEGEIVIGVADLEAKLNEMQRQLDEWNMYWLQEADLPYLAICSRDFLLYLANAVHKRKINTATGFLRTLLPSAPQGLDSAVAALARTVQLRKLTSKKSETAQLFKLISDLNAIVKGAFESKGKPIELPAFLSSYSQMLETHFLERSVVILNVPHQLLVGSSLAAYVSLTRQPMEPTRIFFVTSNTGTDEVERFMQLWSVGEVNDLFIIVHVERLTATSSTLIRDAINRVLPEQRARLLMLAQQHHRVQSTKSLGAKLGLQTDRLLEMKFYADQLREFFTKVCPVTANIHFFTSALPGCGKSQQAMQLAARKKMPYSRIAVREGTVQELMEKLKKLQEKGAIEKNCFLHLDVAHSVSSEFNDVLLSLVLHGALYDPRKSHLGYWLLNSTITVGVEFSSPYGSDDFPIVSYLGTHHKCESDEESFTYELAEMPPSPGNLVAIEYSSELVIAAKFLDLKQAGEAGLAEWNEMCNNPVTIRNNRIPKRRAFQLLVRAFDFKENRKRPTFVALKSMAKFLHTHIEAMTRSLWFGSSARLVFSEDENLASAFKLDVFRLLTKVANDSVSRCWSLVRNNEKAASSDWVDRQRAMLVVGLNERGGVTGINIVGRNARELENMFQGELLEHLKLQELHFQELNGFESLAKSNEGAETILNAFRSLLLLDGTPRNLAKARLMDNQSRKIPPADRFRAVLGKDLGYILTGDNITKMMFALYRIRCGLPIIVFGEAGVGKSALFRFLFETLLGHHYFVCNVNSGTSIQDISRIVDEAIASLERDKTTKAFVLLDEVNTSDPSVIAFVKEVMLDRHMEGKVLPSNLHFIAAANPYRKLEKPDAETSVGLVFRFTESQQNSKLNRDLVYRVNQLPPAFYDHIYDFGCLSQDAEDVYIEEMCQFSLKNYDSALVAGLVYVLQKSHHEARKLSVDPESAVSLRDTARALQLFQWFNETEIGKLLADGDQNVAMQLAIYLVYAFRFADTRKTFLTSVFGEKQQAHNHMRNSSTKIAKAVFEYARGASFGCGAIALNDALCENLFALLVCILNGIFAIIVGRPGTSKSLSVEILKLVLSPGSFKLRETLGDLPAVTELYFQCSPLSTSAGFKALFESAQKLSVDPKTMLAMVVLDELGLADLSPEKPIKVLHSELERKAVLTSGETQQPHYSVIALSNWVVDAAQVNRGILINRKHADKSDLHTSAKELAQSLIAKLVNGKVEDRMMHFLDPYLGCIVELFKKLDRDLDGDGHFYSMRDFFFCVKNFVYTFFEHWDARVPVRNHNADTIFIQSVVRNFGGHEKAKQALQNHLASNLKKSKEAIIFSPVLDLVVQNIQDSSKKHSIHISRHLMILNRSLIGLQLLNKHVKNQLDDGTGWTVLFGSCFPGDLQVTAVTRKLRQVEQAIRRGGVLVLCHADQLFESLYMVLNQQYWAQGDVTMTQIALGPSIRAIALPDGPFRIIALQDTDVALNRQLMSPAVLSRFEKHELRPYNLLNEDGMKLLSNMETHPVWSTLRDVRGRQLLFGCHEDLLASLALHFQDTQEDMEVDSEPAHSRNLAEKLAAMDVALMRAANSTAMIKLERNSNLEQPVELHQWYRDDFIMAGLDDALAKVPSKRLAVMTNTLRYLDILPSEFERPHQIVQLFAIQSELELDNILNSLDHSQLMDPNFCLFVQHDAISKPIEQFQLAKHEINVRLSEANCKVVFIIHLDPRPANNQWVFSFGDGWDYVFVDQLTVQPGHMLLPVKGVIDTQGNRPLADFLRNMTLDRFKSLMLEMLGPALHAPLEILGTTTGPFFMGIRTALQLTDSEQIIQILKECLIAQLDESRVSWSVVDAVNDAHFNASPSLTEGLWEFFKHKMSGPLAHLLLMTDVWRLKNLNHIDMWCAFIKDNFPDRVLVPNSTSALLQVPTGLRYCKQPFGRLLVLVDKSYTDMRDFKLTPLLNWIFGYVKGSERREELSQEYFQDWITMRLPPHLHPLIDHLRLKSMTMMVESMFDNPERFMSEWIKCETDVLAAVEFANLAFSFSNGSSQRTTFEYADMLLIRSWRAFVYLAVRNSLKHLGSPQALDNPVDFIRAITSIEVSKPMLSMVERFSDLSDLWLELRITQRMLLFDGNCDGNLCSKPTPENIIENLTKLVMDSVMQPRLKGDQQRSVRLDELFKFLCRTAACKTVDELGSGLLQCPRTKSLICRGTTGADEKSPCPRCHRVLCYVYSHFKGCRLMQVLNNLRGVCHLKTPKPEAIVSLSEDYNKFMLLFEQVAQLFIEHRRNSSSDIERFLKKLLEHNCRMRVSWRFFAVIVRSLLNNDKTTGERILNRCLQKIPCNQRSSNLDFNTLNFLRALLACADEDVRRETEFNARPLWSEAMIRGQWSVKRIRHLAEIRRLLTEDENDAFLDAIRACVEGERDQGDGNVLLDSFLFFVLRLSSGDGDQTRLSAIFRRQDLPREVTQHWIVVKLRHDSSSTALNLILLPTAGKVNEIEKLLETGQPIDNIVKRYSLLRKLEPQWALHIARLAVHAADVGRSKGIDYLKTLSSDAGRVRNMFLAGIDDHPYLASYRTGKGEWYVCDCQTLCWVLNCGLPTSQSICGGCKRALGNDHKPRYGVRFATANDFSPPKGLFVYRNPISPPTYSVRQQKPVVTRLALLLNSLCLLHANVCQEMADATARKLMETLPLTERINRANGQVDDHRSLCKLLVQHILVDLDIMCKLLVRRPQTRTDQFHIAHVLLNKMMETNDQSFAARTAADFEYSVSAREQFERALDRFVIRQANVETTLYAPQNFFHRMLKRDEEDFWPYARKVSSSRDTVQLALARDSELKSHLPFLALLMDDIDWAPKLNALVHLGDAVRFIALLRSTIQGKLSKEEVDEMTIARGIEKIIKIIDKRAVTLDRGRAVANGDQVHELFHGFQRLWNTFSQIPNAENKTFLEFFECQQVDARVRPDTLLRETAPLVLILAGNNTPEMTFSCQLLANAVEAANSIAQLDFIKQHCPKGSTRSRINCSSAAGLAEFDESLYAHVSREQVDRFIVDHAIDSSTLQLAESYAMAAVLGPIGSTVGADLFLDPIPEFAFKETANTEDHLFTLERRFLSWQPTQLSSQLEESILVDLEKNRSLGEAKSLLTSVLSHLLSNTEPLVISQVRKTYVSDVLGELVKMGILTEQHISTHTLNAFNRHVRVQVYHAMSLLKSVLKRMRGDDPFGGRIPQGWDVMIPERLVRETTEMLRAHAENDIKNTLLGIANAIQSSNPVPNELTPDKPLLQAVQLYEGEEWQGLPAELTLANLGHTLLIAEGL